MHWLSKYLKFADMQESDLYNVSLKAFCMNVLI